jgi:hypothetical protein
MKTTEAINEIAAALAVAQGHMGAALKDSENPHFRSSYADLASVVDAVRPHLSAVGIAIVQLPDISKETGEVRVCTALVHKSGQVLSCTLSATVKDLSPQSIGSAITYLRRYGLMAITGIAPDDDDGEAAMGRPQPQPQPQRPQRREEPAEPPDLVAMLRARIKQLAPDATADTAAGIAVYVADKMSKDPAGAAYGIQSGKHDARLRELVASGVPK